MKGIRTPFPPLCGRGLAPLRAHIECAPTDCAAKRGIDGYRPLHRRGGFHICPRGFPPPHTATAARGWPPYILQNHLEIYKGGSHYVHPKRNPQRYRIPAQLPAYKPEQITAEELEAVTTAGTWAATAMGRQSPVMVAVQDKETLAELSRLNAAVMGTQNDPFYGAPTAVLVLGEKNNPTACRTPAL